MIGFTLLATFECIPHSIVHCSQHVVSHIHNTYLFYNQKFIPYDHLHPIPPHLLPLATTILVSFPMNFFF